MSIQGSSQISTGLSPASSSRGPEASTQKVTNSSRDIWWYHPKLTKLPEPAKEVLRDYAGIPEDDIIDHIYRVREKAWDIYPYPCIGLFKFLDIGAHLCPVYPEILDRLRAGEILLDIGCCFGQDIRKLVVDGAPSENILGVDIEGRFAASGYELFGDRETLKTRFYTQDVFDEEFLPEWHGRIDMINLGSFLHLFDFKKQTVIVAQLAKLLKKGKGSLVFGKTLAADQGGMFHVTSMDLYFHSQETIRKLWDEAPEGSWEVTTEIY